jgi:hypothetical protein
VVYSFGAGYFSAMRSLVTALAPQHRITLLYTTMAVFEGAAAFCAAPLPGRSFSTGIEMGGIAVSLPFFYRSYAILPGYGDPFLQQVYCQRRRSQ